MKKENFGDLKRKKEVFGAFLVINQNDRVQNSFLKKYAEF